MIGPYFQFHFQSPIKREKMGYCKHLLYSNLNGQKEEGVPKAIAFGTPSSFKTYKGLKLLPSAILSFFSFRFLQ